MIRVSYLNRLNAAVQMTPCKAVKPPRLITAFLQLFTRPAGTRAIATQIFAIDGFPQIKPPVPRLPFKDRMLQVLMGLTLSVFIARAKVDRAGCILRLTLSRGQNA